MCVCVCVYVCVYVCVCVRARVCVDDVISEMRTSACIGLEGTVAFNEQTPFTTPGVLAHTLRNLVHRVLQL